MKHFNSVIFLLQRFFVLLGKIGCENWFKPLTHSIQMTREKIINICIDIVWSPITFHEWLLIFIGNKMKKRKQFFILVYLRGDLSSFRLVFDFFVDELLDDVDRELLRSLFELEPFDDDDDFEDDFEPLPLPDLPDDDLDNGLVGEREFLCLWLSLLSKSIELLLLLTWGLFVVSL